MHAHELAELAVLACIHCRRLVAADDRLVDEALETYWTASRCRLDRWCRSLRTLADQTGPRKIVRWEPQFIAVVEELLVSEILTRSFAAILAAHDRAHDRSESDPIGRNIMSGHIDASRRAMHLVAPSARGNSTVAGGLDSLRLRCERWSDLLLAYLPLDVAVDDFAVDLPRVHEFANDVCLHTELATTSSSAVALLSAGIHNSCESSVEGDAPNADLNRQIATAVLACFGPEFFDSHGLLRTVWLDRLQAVSDETLALLDQWWQPPPIAPSDPLPPPWQR